MKSKTAARHHIVPSVYPSHSGLATERSQYRKSPDTEVYVWAFVAEGIYYVAFEEVNQKKIEATYKHMPSDFRVKISDSRLPTRNGQPKTGVVHFSAGSSGRKRENGHYTPHLRTSGTRCEVKRLTGTDVDVGRLLSVGKMPIKLCVTQRSRYIGQPPVSISADAIKSSPTTFAGQTISTSHFVPSRDSSSTGNFLPGTSNGVVHYTNIPLTNNWGLLPNEYQQPRQSTHMGITTQHANNTQLWNGVVFPSGGAISLPH